MRYLPLLIIGIFFLGCKKSEAPKAPGKAILVLPAKNTECAVVQGSAGNTNVVQFTWQAVANAEIYELRVTNLNSGTAQTKSTRALSETLPLSKGSPFSWSVISKNNLTPETAVSETWFFYNPGTENTYAPFPAEILEPLQGAQVFKDISNEITLIWDGSDLDGDIVGYEVYFSVETPPETLIASPTEGTKRQKVTVSANTVYYWKVITKDSEGNTSDSGIFNFKVL
ncbi:MAG: hypothetical protein E4H26_11355 [Flavobacteriales bacterium]|nr:MAG: hypothetical protein E4H26_11355 [Flavobacteriales bacterium]